MESPILELGSTVAKKITMSPIVDRTHHRIVSNLRTLQPEIEKSLPVSNQNRSFSDQPNKECSLSSRKTIPSIPYASLLPPVQEINHNEVSLAMKKRINLIGFYAEEKSIRKLTKQKTLITKSSVVKARNAQYQIQLEEFRILYVIPKKIAASIQNISRQCYNKKLRWAQNYLSGLTNPHGRPREHDNTGKLAFMSEDISTGRKDQHNLRADGTIRRRMVCSMSVAYVIAKDKYGYRLFSNNYMAALL